MLIDFKNMSNAEVIECYSQTTKELKKREIIRTKNIT